jgi:hypothetical protein
VLLWADVAGSWLGHTDVLSVAVHTLFNIPNILCLPTQPNLLCRRMLVV